MIGRLQTRPVIAIESTILLSGIQNFILLPPPAPAEVCADRLHDRPSTPCSNGGLAVPLLCTFHQPSPLRGFPRPFVPVAILYPRIKIKRTNGLLKPDPSEPWLTFPYWAHAFLLSDGGKQGKCEPLAWTTKTSSDQLNSTHLSSAAPKLTGR